MSDQTLLYWGMVVTMFLVIAAIITAREMVESDLKLRYGNEDNPGEESSADDRGLTGNTRTERTE